MGLIFILTIFQPSKLAENTRDCLGRNEFSLLLFGVDYELDRIAFNFVRYRGIVQLLVSKLQGMWFEQDGDAYHADRETIHIFSDTLYKTSLSKNLKSTYRCT